MHRRAHIHQHANIGEKIADQTAASIGSWGFIIAQAALMAVWFILNTAGWFVWKWDLYPFVFLNLAMSAEAAFSAPIIMMSQNRQATKDRKRDDLEADEVAQILNNHQELLDINRKLFIMQNQQMKILDLIMPNAKPVQEPLDQVSPLVNPKTRIRKPIRREDLR